MEDKDIIAGNLAYYRKKSGLSQIELAQKLKYSNKNISKWENGETTPSVFVLKSLADLYGITIDDLLKQPTTDDKLVYDEYVQAKTRRKRVRNVAYLLMANAVLYLVACVAILVLGLYQVSSFNKWLLLLYATPLSCISVFVFIRCIYKRLDFLSVSLMGWLIATSVYVSLPLVSNIKMVFIVAAAYQVLIIFVSLITNLKLVDKFANSFKQLKEKYVNKKQTKNSAK